MNICIISQRYPYKDNMEFVFVKKIVDEWAKMGHHCVVIAPFPQITYLRDRIDYKPHFYRDEIRPGLFVDVYSPRFMNLDINIRGVSLSYLLATRSIGKLIQRLGVRFDAIYCHFFSSALKGFRYAYQHKVPFFIATGESEIDSLPKPYLKFEWENFRSFTKGVVAVSSKNKSEASKIGYIDESKCRIFPNGTDTQLFKPLDRNECRKQLGLPQNVFIISCVGFICERKGQNRLLESVRKINNKNIKLIYLGAEAKVETFHLEGDEILYKGSVENKNLPIYLSASDVFCLPTRAEGCCNAIIEALACGLPIISSNLPFNWDVLDDSNSIMINPDSVDDIAEAVLTLYNNVEMRNAKSKGALKKATSLDIHQRAECILSFMKESKE